MSGTVAEFMSKKGIKKYANGLKNKVVKALAATAVLAAAFGATSCQEQNHIDMDVQDWSAVRTTYAVTAEGDTLCAYQAVPVNCASYERLQNLVNNATKSDAGREVLKAISEQGTVLRIDQAGKNTIGYFSSNDNSVCLNSNFSDKALQSTLIHEGRHSMQWQRLPVDDYQYTFSSMVMMNRVMEADAMATETKFAFEMAQQGDGAALQAMRSEHEGIVSAYVNGCEKYGENSDKAMKETMLAWYKDKSYVGQYDQAYADYFTKLAEQTSTSVLQMGNCFSKTMNADELITAVCSWKGNNYAGTDGSILKTPETAYLGTEFYTQVVNSGVKLSERTFGEIKDTSVNDFYVLKDGKIQKQTYQQMNQGNRNKSVQTAKMMLHQKYAQQR